MSPAASSSNSATGRAPRPTRWIVAGLVAVVLAATWGSLRAVLSRPPSVPGTLTVIETEPLRGGLWCSLLVRSVDLDGDGRRELVVGNDSTPAGGGRVEVFRTDGSSVFEWRGDEDWRLGHEAHEVPDLDGDGWRELLLDERSRRGNGCARLRSGASGLELEFQVPKELRTHGRRCLADVDGDGIPELIVLPADGRTAHCVDLRTEEVERSIELPAAFAEAVARESSYEAFASLADVDGDGHDDLALSDPGYQSGEIWEWDWEDFIVRPRSHVLIVSGAELVAAFGSSPGAGVETREDRAADSSHAPVDVDDGAR